VDEQNNLLAMERFWVKFDTIYVNIRSNITHIGASDLFVFRS